uniref:NADH dehydrogenase subunit 4 n=1 Tax=Parascaris univalens TaxID=6257 RepID=A0A915ALX3_PARUN
MLHYALSISFVCGNPTMMNISIILVGIWHTSTLVLFLCYSIFRSLMLQ